MSVATAEPIRLSSRPPRDPKSKPKPSRDTARQLTQLSALISTYDASSLATNLTTHLHSLSKAASTPITRILSLGLGPLTHPSKHQSRRLKQLTLLLALRDTLQSQSPGHPVTLYAQDPSFTKADEALLSALSIRVLRTPSGSSLGEAADVITPDTLVYSPFLTLEAYEALLLGGGRTVRYLLGDDFGALLEKWPRGSEERAQVVRVVKGAVGGYRRRVVKGEGFWEVGDGAFGMALYSVEGRGRGRM